METGGTQIFHTKKEVLDTGVELPLPTTNHIVAHRKFPGSGTDWNDMIQIYCINRNVWVS